MMITEVTEESSESESEKKSKSMSNVGGEFHQDFILLNVVP